MKVHGKDKLDSITYKNNKSGEEIKYLTPAMFIFIGARPHTEMLKDVVRLSDSGFILTGIDLKVDGKFKG